MWMGSTVELHAICVFCYTYLSFVSTRKLGISPKLWALDSHESMWAQEIAESLHRERRKIMMVFVANSVCSRQLIYLSVASAT